VVMLKRVTLSVFSALTPSPHDMQAVAWPNGSHSALYWPGGHSQVPFAVV
jgi:hypothetical protein